MKFFLLVFAFIAQPAIAQVVIPLEELSRLPERGIFPETIGRIQIRDEKSRYITFVEVEGEEVYRTVMDCQDWRSRRFTVSRARPYDANWAFQENQRSKNLITIQASYCSDIDALPMLDINYEKDMRKQVYKDRSLVPAEYFLKCPRKDSRQWPCIDHRDTWEEQEWNPLP